jgi:hypothetical protein
LWKLTEKKMYLIIPPNPTRRNASASLLF